MEASVKHYAPEGDLHVFRPAPATFGEVYNAAMAEVFKTCDEMIVANDDIVLRPDTMRILMEDVDQLKQQYGDKVGMVATRADFVRDPQHIKYNDGSQCLEATVVSPLFAWISKKAFDVAQFGPLNWYSDDVICEDLNELGFKNFISRAYVHHVGSQTVGVDYNKLNNDALPWLQANRPQYLKKWWGW
jgi:hypothetical protein